MKIRRLAIRGKIKYEDSGIYIELPKGWVAHKIEGSYACSKGNGSNHDGILCFLVHSYLEPGVFPLEDIKEPTTRLTKGFGGAEISVEVKRDGEFFYHELPQGEEEDGYGMYIWETDTEKYKITFNYLATEDQMKRGIKDVRKILDSLVKYPRSS